MDHMYIKSKGIDSVTDSVNKDTQKSEALSWQAQLDASLCQRFYQAAKVAPMIKKSSR